MTRAPAATIAVAVLLLATSCTSGGRDTAASITWSAASSLQDVAGPLVADFEDQNPGAEVRTNFGSSTQLAAQVAAGAPADVVAFADEESMARLAEAGLLEGEPETFATNELVVATRPGNPGDVRSIGELTSLGVVAICAADAPCGRYSAELLAEAGVDLDESSVTRGQNATATLAALTEGDADAAIVYRSDAVRAVDRIELVPLPATLDGPLAHYPAGVLAGSEDRELAAEFVEHLLSARAGELLAEAGFGPP